MIAASSRRLHPKDRALAIGSPQPAAGLVARAFPPVGSLCYGCRTGTTSTPPHPGLPLPETAALAWSAAASPLAPALGRSSAVAAKKR